MRLSFFPLIVFCVLEYQCLRLQLIEDELKIAALDKCSVSYQVPITALSATIRNIDWVSEIINLAKPISCSILGGDRSSVVGDHANKYGSRLVCDLPNGGAFIYATNEDLTKFVRTTAEIIEDNLFRIQKDPLIPFTVRRRYCNNLEHTFSPLISAIQKAIREGDVASFRKTWKVPQEWKSLAFHVDPTTGSSTAVFDKGVVFEKPDEFGISVSLPISDWTKFSFLENTAEKQKVLNDFAVNFRLNDPIVPRESYLLQADKPLGLRNKFNKAILTDSMIHGKKFEWLECRGIADDYSGRSNCRLDQEDENCFSDQRPQTAHFAILESDTRSPSRFVMKLTPAKPKDFDVIFRKFVLQGEKIEKERIVNAFCSEISEFIRRIHFEFQKAFWFSRNQEVEEPPLWQGVGNYQVVEKSQGKTDEERLALSNKAREDARIQERHKEAEIQQQLVCAKEIPIELEKLIPQDWKHCASGPALKLFDKGFLLTSLEGDRYFYLLARIDVAKLLYLAQTATGNQEETLTNIVSRYRDSRLIKQMPADVLEQQITGKWPEVRTAPSLFRKTYGWEEPALEVSEDPEIVSISCVPKGSSTLATRYAGRKRDLLTLVDPISALPDSEREGRTATTRVSSMVKHYFCDSVWDRIENIYNDLERYLLSETAERNKKGRRLTFAIGDEIEQLFSLPSTSEADE